MRHANLQHILSLDELLELTPRKILQSFIPNSWGLRWTLNATHKLVLITIPMPCTHSDTKVKQLINKKPGSKKPVKYCKKFYGQLSNVTRLFVLLLSPCREKIPTLSMTITLRQDPPKHYFQFLSSAIFHRFIYIPNIILAGTSHNNL